MELGDRDHGEKRGGDGGTTIVPGVRFLEVLVLLEIDDLPEPALEAALGDEHLAEGFGVEARSYSKP